MVDEEEAGVVSVDEALALAGAADLEGAAVFAEGGEVDSAGEGVAEALAVGQADLAVVASGDVAVHERFVLTHIASY